MPKAATRRLLRASPSFPVKRVSASRPAHPRRCLSAYATMYDSAPSIHARRLPAPPSSFPPSGARAHFARLSAAKPFGVCHNVQLHAQYPCQRRQRDTYPRAFLVSSVRRASASRPSHPRRSISAHAMMYGSAPSIRAKGGNDTPARAALLVSSVRRASASLPLIRGEAFRRMP